MTGDVSGDGRISGEMLMEVEPPEGGPGEGGPGTIVMEVTGEVTGSRMVLEMISVTEGLPFPLVASGELERQ